MISYWWPHFESDFCPSTVFSCPVFFTIPKKAWWLFRQRPHKAPLSPQRAARGLLQATVMLPANPLLPCLRGKWDRLLGGRRSKEQILWSPKLSTILFFFWKKTHLENFLPETCAWVASICWNHTWSTNSLSQFASKPMKRMLVHNTHLPTFVHGEFSLLLT